MSEQNKIDEIKEALAAATSGKWQIEGREIWRRGHSYHSGETTEDMHIWITDVHHDGNRYLIAKAPEYITYLLAELERKDAAMERKDKALKWYADVEKRTYDDYCEDLGDRARAAL